MVLLKDNNIIICLKSTLKTKLILTFLTGLMLGVVIGLMLSFFIDAYYYTLDSEQYYKDAMSIEK